MDAKAIIKALSSVRLTVICLLAGVVLVFIGTLAQVDMGLYKAQNDYFRSFFVYWKPKGTEWHIPVFFGGYTVGGVLLVNLLGAYVKYFKFTKKKAGIIMIHSGIILLLLGQLSTDLLQTESIMRLTEGQAKNYSDSRGYLELAVVETLSGESDQVVSIPAAQLKKGTVISNSELPFTIRVKEYFDNSVPEIRAPFASDAPQQAEHGLGERFHFEPQARTTKMDDKDVPSVIVELITPKGSLGDWLLSAWATDSEMSVFLKYSWQRNPKIGKQMGDRLFSSLTQPNVVEVDGRHFEIALRPLRYYKPFHLELLKFSHEIYLGTDIPKNFSSKVRLERPSNGENREVLIFMNSPLRYWGETYYQSGYDERDPRVTILQVVRNPGWLTPYFSCILVGAGMITQFMSHLIGFTRKKAAAAKVK